MADEVTVMESVRVQELRSQLGQAIEQMEDANTALTVADSDEDSEALEERFNERVGEVQRRRANLERTLQAESLRVDIPLPGDTEARGGRITPAPRVTAAVRVASKLTYERGARPETPSFFSDLYRQRKGDPYAGERLRRHMHEMTMVERRDISSTDGVGGDFVPPLWMMDDFIALARAGRPFANAVQNLPLPPKTDSLNVPRISTGAATAVQADLGAVQETDPTTGSLSVPVKTIAGQVDVSQQLLDRSQPGIDQILFNDLARDYATKLDLQVLNGSGAGANAKGVLQDAARIQVTYTDATPTVPEFYSKIADAAQQIFTNIFMAPTGIFMHPRRWAWIMAASDNSNRPLMAPVAPMNAPGQGAGNFGEGQVGSLLGIPVFLDASLPSNLGAGTNEDTVIVARLDNLYLWEDGTPRSRVLEEVLSGNLAVRLQVYGYFAFSSERLSKSTATVGGTGMIAPTF